MEQTNLMKKWKIILRKHEASGMSAVVFCRERQIPLSTFGYWKRKLGERGTDRGFGLVAIARPVAVVEETGRMSLMVAGRYRFEWQEGLSTQMLLRLIEGLERRS
jgi:hypothetical protein